MAGASQHTPGTALYYPYIHPRKMGHLKVALLYWDRVRRIVPREMDVGGWVADDEVEACVLAERGLLVGTHPMGYEEKAAERFFQHVEPHGQRFRIDLGDGKDLAEAHRGLHIEKIGFETVQRLESLGLAQRVGDWVSMSREVGAFYMFCLASEMGRSMNAPLYSDTSEDMALGEAFLFEPDVEDTPDAPEATEPDDLLALGIRLPSPEQMDDIPAADLATFCEKHGPERQRFREAIEGIMGAVRSARDPHLVNDYLEAKRRNILEAVNDLNGALTEIRVSVVETTARITVPAGIAALASTFAFPPAVAAILAALGVGLGVIKSVVETRGKLQKLRTSSPYHYLVSLEQLTGLPPIR